MEGGGRETDRGERAGGKGARVRALTMRDQIYQGHALQSFGSRTDVFELGYVQVEMGSVLVLRGMSPTLFQCTFGDQR